MPSGLGTVAAVHRLTKGGELSDATTLLELGQALRDLTTLEAIEESPSISQRDLARRLGIALGLTNACLTRMANTGLIKIRRANSRNLTYHLTRAGIATKARLSVEYAKATVGLYNTTKQSVSEGLTLLADRGVSRLGLLGATDVAEIVEVVCAHQGLEIVCVADETPGMLGTGFMGRTVMTIAEFEPSGCEVVIVTYLDNADFWVEHVKRQLPERITVLKAL